MNILYITNLFGVIGSSAAVRNSALIKGLVKNGHTVNVLTIQHPQDRLSKFLCSCGYNKLFPIEMGITNFIQRTSKIRKKVNRSVLKSWKKIFREIVFFPDIFIRWADKITPSDYGDYDVIISSSDYKSSHFVAKRIKEVFPEKRWIQIWDDPWSLDSTLSRISRFRAKYAERKLFCHADKIVFVSELTCDALIKIYPCYSKKMYYVPRSYYQEINVLRKEGKQVYDIVYTGALGVGRNFENFLCAIKEYNTRSKCLFKVHFYGNYSNEQMDKLQKFDFVTVNGTVDYEEVLKLFSQMDALLFISNKSTSTQIPGKLFDYFGTNLPIICITNNNAKLETFLIRYSKCLLFQGDFVSVANQIINNSSFEVVKSYSPEHIAKDILGV